MKIVPKVSVIMPFYNCEKFLDESISSVLNQTFNEFELILINDHSSDASSAIVNKYLEDERVIYISNTARKGKVSNLNLGLQKAFADIVAIMDGDDVSEPNRLEEEYGHSIFSGIKVNMKNIFFIGHSTYKKGIPSDTNYAITYAFLEHYFNKDYRAIRHSLGVGGETRLYRNGVNGAYTKFSGVGLLPDPVRYVVEILINMAVLLWYKPNTVLSIDPLSAFAPCLLKKIGYVKNVFFITPDFARRRFSNAFLNKVYYLCDKFCTLNCTKNLVCAKTVIDYKMQIYASSNLKFEQLFHMPNIPNPWIIEKYKDLQKISGKVIYVGNVSGQIDFKDIFQTIRNLQQQRGEISLTIVGTGNTETELKKYVATEKLSCINFLGQLTFEETLREIADSEIGIALYNGAFNYDEFRDSCKIREYQALGTIPITTEVVKANADEIKELKSGVIVKDQQGLTERLRELLSDKEKRTHLRFQAVINYEIYRSKYDELFSLINQV